MDEREAIWRLKNHFAVHDDGRPTPLLDKAVAIAITALEKQIPKKPWNDLGEAWCCSVCGCEVDLKDNYCFYCGQRLE